MLDLLDYSLITCVVVVSFALLTGILHGATGMAGGIVMAAVLAHIIGIKTAIPVMTCALVISHFSRVLLYFSYTDWAVVRRVLLFSSLTIAFGSWVFTFLTGQTVALIMAIFLSLSFPVKAYARKHKLQTSPTVLAGASSLWGLLAGNVIGPGFLLAPFLLGTGMNRLSFVGSLATIVLVMNVIKLSVFGLTELMDARMINLGVLIGIVTIPGNWIGKQILHKMTDKDHASVLDLMTLLLIVNFIYLGSL